jgi:OmpA family
VRLKLRSIVVLAAFVLPCAQAAELVRFVSCPVYRDTRAGRKSGCWLADDPASGLRYDVTPSPTKPDWNFAVLVEGSVAAGDLDPCGGIVLDPVRVSRLMDASCPRHMLPAEGFPGRPFALPERNVRPVFDARAKPPGPYATTTFYLFFEFGTSFVSYQYGDYLLDQAITWIRAAEPKKIVITGYAASKPAIVSGRVLREDPDLARARAEKLQEALLRLGVPEKKISVRWRTDPEPVDVAAADGIASASLRRVEIRAEL